MIANTDYVDDVNLKYIFGYLIGGVLGMNMFINFCIILYGMIRTMSLNARKWYKLIMRKLTNKQTILNKHQLNTTQNLLLLKNPNKLHKELVHFQENRYNVDGQLFVIQENGEEVGFESEDDQTSP